MIIVLNRFINECRYKVKYFSTVLSATNFHEKKSYAISNYWF